MLSFRKHRIHAVDRCTSKELCRTVRCRHISLGERYVCRDASDCYSQASCDGLSPQCPVSALRLDGTPCHGGVRACSQGRCRQSLCVMAALDDCFCVEAAEDRCKLCCRRPEGPACLPASSFNITGPSGGIIYLPEGDGCLNYRGVCSGTGRGEERFCVTVDNLDGDFSALIGFEQQSGSGAKNWLYNTWFYFLLIPLVPAVVAVAVLRGPRLWGRFQSWLDEESSVNAEARLFGLIAAAQSRSETFRLEAERASAACDRICSRLERQHRLQRQPRRLQRDREKQSPGITLRRYSNRTMGGSFGSYGSRKAKGGLLYLSLIHI